MYCHSNGWGMPTVVVGCDIADELLLGLQFALKVVNHFIAVIEFICKFFTNEILRQDKSYVDPTIDVPWFIPLLKCVVVIGEIYQFRVTQVLYFSSCALRL